MFRSFLLRTQDYMENTSIHGLRYIFDKDSHWLERIFWIAVCGFCVFGTYTVFVASLYSYEHNSVSFVTETTYLNWNTSFPAVSVCEILSKDKVYIYGNITFGPDRNLNLDTYLEEIVYFGGTCDSCSDWCSILDCPKNVSGLVSTVRASCKEIFNDCRFSGEPFDCCDHFLPLKTEYGVCYTINSIHAGRSFHENRKKINLLSNRKNGPGELSFRANETVKILIHSPEDVPFINHAEDEQGIVPWGHFFAMKFQITEIVNDPMMSDIPVESRKCRFPDENPLKIYSYYSYSACVVECHAAAQLRFCGCVHHLMPDQGFIAPVCDIKGLICLSKTSDEWRSLKTEWSDKPGLVCDCLPSCTEQEYKVLDKYKILLEDDPAYEDLEKDRKGSLAIISMETLPTERFSRNVVRSRLDLVVSLGGTAGLFLGASLLSTVEVIYYFCIRTRKSTDEQTAGKKMNGISSSARNEPKPNGVNKMQQLLRNDPEQALIRKVNYQTRALRGIYVSRGFDPYYYRKDYVSNMKELYM